MSRKPKLSILMPVYNSAAYLREAVESVLAQDYQDFELLLLDDGSTDDSLAILERFQDPRLRLLVDGKNLRQPRRYNQGVQLSQGKYIAIMHSDDIALPERFSKQIAFLERHPEYDLLGSFVQLIQDKQHTNRQIGIAGEGDFLRLFCLFNTPFIHPTMVFRRAVLEQTAYNENFTTAEDYELWSRILSKYKAKNLGIPLLQLRIHAQKNAKRHKTQQLKNIVQIVRQQLEELDITYRKEWENCSKWVSNSYLDALTRQQLGEVEWYLLALQSELLDTQIFKVEEVKKVISITWLRVCMKSAKTGLAIWSDYLVSPLSKHSRNVVSVAKLLAKCLLRM